MVLATDGGHRSCSRRTLIRSVPEMTAGKLGLLTFLRLPVQHTFFPLNPSMELHNADARLLASGRI